MLNTEPKHLWEEIQSAVKYRDKRLAARETLIAQYHGGAWLGNLESTGTENHPYEFLTAMVPRMVHNPPTVKVHSNRNTPVHRMTAEAIDLGLKRWVEDSSITANLRYMAVDMCMSWGYLMITMEDRPEMTAPEDMDVQEVGWPVVRRLSPDDVFFDPAAKTQEEVRFTGHRYQVDLEDIIADAEANEDGTWNLEEAKKLQPASGVGGQGSRRETDTPDRSQVWIYEVWLSEDEAEKQDGEHNGRIHTIALGQEEAGSNGTNPVTIRAPRDYYGPETGPYKIFGAHYVPDHPAPLAPLVATHAQSMDVAEVGSAITTSIKAQKRFILTRGSKISDAVQKTPHGHIYNIGVEMDDKNVRQLEIGGTTPGQVGGEQILRDRLARVSGLSDSLTGSAGGETATAEQIAFQAANTRVDDLRKSFESCAGHVLRHVAWYMYHDDTVVFPLMLDGAEGTEDELWFQGGTPVEVDMSFADLELKIEPYSMERTNDPVRQQRLLQPTMMALQMGQAMLQLPHLNWKELARDVGVAYNQSDFERRFNWDVLQQYYQAQGMNVMIAAGQPASATGKQTGQTQDAEATVRPAGNRSGSDANASEAQ